MRTIPVYKTIYFRFMVVFLVAIGPLVAVQYWLSRAMFDDALAQGSSLLERAAYQAAAVQDAMAAQVRQTLKAAASEPALRDGPPEAADAVLARLAQTLPFANNIHASDLSGAMRFSLVKPFAGTRVGARRYFIEALRRGDFAVGEYVVGQVTAKPSIHFAHPLLDVSGAPSGVLGAAVGLDWYQSLFDRCDMPAGAFLAFFDRQGVLLARYPSSASLRPGQRFDALFAGQFAWGRSSGVFMAANPDGVDTLYAYKTLSLERDGRDPYGVMFVGMAARDAQEAARSRALLAAGVSAGAVALAVAAAAVLCRLVFVKRLRVLADFADSLGMREACLLPPRFGDDEIGVLGRRMADISEALQEKSEHLDEVMAKLAHERDAMAETVEQLRLAEEELVRRADHDALTGLENRGCFVKRFGGEMARLRRHGEPFALVILDIDDFKLVNDRFGHGMGDEVLRAVAGALRASLREVDGVYRVGGEEFAVILPGADGPSALAAAERLRRAVAALDIPLPDGAGAARVTVSLGAAEAEPAMDAEKELFAAADRALYAAKAAGKNRCVLAGREQA
ncbi:MAG: diguanylate cyclase (GGDEF) domain-containing protein [Solidesulfovibrio magneticus str. Maddingley MBC34]|uniref:diguanylate cyclase n=1 Tax=Solidesulfovibrio magneticus str. Maddingley MBC34 TaxID=1206767 RepID=K6FRB1_9BACT|nr:MAG: diguanylate cyclase (GGDEF) domain-containing protein [Solidesulfovibrio magneticus str. Maddingley MBC34]